jgi:predicted permease
MTKETLALLRALPAAHVAARSTGRPPRRRDEGTMKIWMQEMRMAARGLSRARLFTGIALASLALGIGAAGAVSNLARGVLLAPHPYPEGDRLVLLWSTDVKRDIQRWQVTVADFLDWRERSETVEAMAPYRPADYNLSTEDSPVRVAGYRVGVDLFRVLGVQPALGRSFLPEEESPASERVALLSHGLWQAHFGGDPDVVGTTLRLDDISHTVVGVLPPQFSFPERGVDLFVPLRFETAGADRVSRAVSVVGLLAEGATLSQARQEMEALARALAQEYPESNSATGAWVAPLREELVLGARARILALSGSVILLLLVTCANLMGLLLIRWTERKGDLAVRTAIGASRLQQLRVLLWESLFLGTAGGLGGLFVATALTRITVRFVPSSIPVEGTTGLSPGLVASTLGIALLASALFGVGPALAFSGTPPADLLRLRRTGPSLKTRRVQGALVVGEVALALALAVGSGLLFRSMQRLSGEELGFHPAGALVARMEPPASRYSEPGALSRLYDDVLEGVEALPGVTAAGFVSYAPMTGGGGMIYYEPPGAQEREGPPDLVYVRMSTPDLFRALGSSVVTGRSFQETDRAGAPLVAVVNEAFSERYLGGTDAAVGSDIPLAAFETHARVVGVLGDIRYVSMDAEPWPAIHLHEAQIPSYTFFTPRDLIVRTAGDPLVVAGAIRSQVEAADPALPLFDVRTLTDILGARLEEPRFQLHLFAGFALVALFLSCLGIFAVVQYSVQNRRREIGVRVALGAGPGVVARGVLKQGAVLVGMGVVLGLGGALALGRVLEGILYETTVRDPLTFVATTLMVGSAGLLAGYLPSRRATRVDPMAVLREE